MPRSLHGRMLLAASLVLAGFLGLTGVALDRAYRESAEAAMWERLRGHVYALLAAADVGDDGLLRLPMDLPDPRFSNPESGLYARVEAGDRAYHWTSPSSLGRAHDYLRALPAGEWRQLRVPSDNGVPLLAVNFGVVWEDDHGGERAYTFAVAESAAGLSTQVGAFRHSLFIWLGGMALALLLIQGAIVSWGLRPLRRLAADLRRIEAGTQELLVGNYPRELRVLTGNLNSLLQSSQARQERYRNTLGELAHSMKTPMAIIQGALDVPGSRAALAAVVEEQSARINRVVEYHLQRAAARGRSSLLRAVAVAPLVDKVVDALDKVHADKGVRCQRQGDGALRFIGDEGDLLEVIGNLLDNAYKWSRGRVVVRTSAEDRPEWSRPGLLVEVEDDGPGIPEDRAHAVRKMGVRADQRTPGHGIGLAMTDEILRLYGGSLSIGRGQLGGARLMARFPGG